MKLVWIALGGALGALCRYLCSQWVSSFGHVFPFGTLTVNLVGCLLIGGCWGWIDSSGVCQSLRLFFMVGFIGAFTTFSTYVLELGSLANQGRWGALGSYLVLSHLFGLIFLFLGRALYRMTL